MLAASGWQERESLRHLLALYSKSQRPSTEYIYYGQGLKRIFLRIVPANVLQDARCRSTGRLANGGVKAAGNEQNMSALHDKWPCRPGGRGLTAAVRAKVMPQSHPQTLLCVCMGSFLLPAGSGVFSRDGRETC